ncbi:MAG: chemotaxis response regulator protein-glutamate methylesterase [Bdellovibrionales bacterium]|nr:chemotaxis response regulator protein-glutamate methylesterase [Bdellovibrionales bacterium]
MGNIKVLIVDDSAVIRKFLEKVLSLDSEIEVVGTAEDPYQAREKLVALKPDVMTLDVEMPKMDGITFLSKVMKHFPIRTIVFSSFTAQGSDSYFRAMEAGAIEVLEKPSIEVNQKLDLIATKIIQTVKMVSKARLQPLAESQPSAKVEKKELKPISVSPSLHRSSKPEIIAVASSTGGTEALKVFLKNMPADIPGTVIVQHMPPGFTKSFANHLNEVYPFEVKEAENGDVVTAGRVLIAPGDFHMEIRRSGLKYSIILHQDVPLHSVRPAADYLLKSVAKCAGSNSVGVVLTGMGKDGAEGLLEMKRNGAYTIAQDEKSCVVYGMPQAAVNIGAVDKILSLDKIGDEVLSHFKKKIAS